jgi:DNA-binding response OmpR family regulator
MSILEYIREKRLPLAVVIVTGSGDEETEAAAFRAGADDFVHKTGNCRGRLSVILEKALERFRGGGLY